MTASRLHVWAFVIASGLIASACGGSDPASPDNSGDVVTITVRDLSSPGTDASGNKTWSDTVDFVADVRDGHNNPLPQKTVVWRLVQSQTIQTPASDTVATIATTGPQAARLIRRGHADANVVVIASVMTSGGLVRWADAGVQWRAIPAIPEFATVVWVGDSDPTVLPVPDDASDLEPITINDAGEVAGMIRSKDNHYYDAFVWSASKGLRRLGLSSQTESYLNVNAMSSTGVVIGELLYHGGIAEGFVWAPDGNPAPLPPKRFLPVSINSKATMIGWDSTAPMTWATPARWSLNTGVQALPVTGDPCLGAGGINDSDEIVGWTGDEDCNIKALIIWRPGEKPVEIKRCEYDYCFLQVVGINALGHVAGTMDFAAFRMSTRPGESMAQSLMDASASGINDHDDVAGSVRGKPILWTADGQVRFLKLPPGFIHGWAKAVNNRGGVVGRLSKL